MISIGLTDRSPPIRSFFRSCLINQSFRPYAPQNECQALWGFCDPILAYQSPLEFVWAHLPELCKKTCLRMG